MQQALSLACLSSCVGAWTLNYITIRNVEILTQKNKKVQRILFFCEGKH
jgi:hypothetical protein